MIKLTQFLAHPSKPVPAWVDAYSVVWLEDLGEYRNIHLKHGWLVQVVDTAEDIAKACDW